MFIVKFLWLIYILVQVECHLQETYFLQKEMKVDTGEATKLIPNSSKIACVLACKQEPGCKESGLSHDSTCYLFKGKVEKNELAKISLTVFIDKAAQAPQRLGMLSPV